MVQFIVEASSFTWNSEVVCLDMISGLGTGLGSTKAPGTPQTACDIVKMDTEVYAIC